MTTPAIRDALVDLVELHRNHANGLMGGIRFPLALSDRLDRAEAALAEAPTRFANAREALDRLDSVFAAGLQVMWIDA